MSTGLDNEDFGMPGDIFGVLQGPTSSNTLSDIQSNLAIANDIANDVESELAIQIAGCLQGAITCDEDCQRCINGQLDNDLRQKQDLIAKLDNKVQQSVQNGLSEAIAVSTNLGIPITDLILVNGEPITINGEPNQPQDEPITTVSAVICPPETTPVLSGNDTIYCLPPNTPPTTVEGIEAGDIIPPDVLQAPTVSFPVNQPAQSPLGGQVTLPQPITPALPTPVPVPGRPPIPTQQPVTPQPPIVPSNGQFATAPSNIFQCDDVNQPTVNRPLSDWLAEHRITQFFTNTEYINSIVNNAVQTGQSIGVHLVDLGNGVASIDATCSVLPTTNQCPPCPTATGPAQPISAQPPPTKPPIPFCDPTQANDILNTIDNLAQTGGEAYQQTAAYIRSIFGVKETGSFGATDILTKPIEVITAGIVGTLTSVIDAIFRITDTTGFVGGGCSGNAFATQSIANGIVGLFGGWFGFVPENTRIPNQYGLNLICQYILPSGPEANVLRNRNWITQDQWEFLIKANGLCVPWQELVKKAGQFVPTPDQAAMMERRKLISYDEFKTFARRNGVQEDSDAALLYNMTEFVPGPSDLVRMMVRDVFDEQVVQTNQLDSDFEKKFTGRAKEWAEAQGMSEQQFRSYWRAHWDYPSNTQLYTMLHRLREDTTLPMGMGVAKAVTAEDIKRTLAINDISPEWVDRLIAISYNPLTRVDTRRAFEIGAIDREQVRESYLNQGYSPKDTDILVDFTEQVSGPTRAKRLGNASSTEILGWYKDQLISREFASTLLEKAGIRQETVSAHLDSVDLKRTVGFRKQAVQALRKRYMTGEFTTREITDQLSRVGIDPSVSGEMIFQWQIVRDAKYKAPTVSMLCKWWQRGLITLQNFMDRCRNLGYMLEDAERIVNSCQIDQSEKLAKERERLAKEAQAESRRQESNRRRIVADQRRDIKEIERRIKEAAPCKPPPKPVCDTNGQQ